MHALIKVHHHFLTVSDLLKANKVDRFQKYQGRQARQCCGGISMSLDLSKAFDKVHRPKLYASLADNGVDQTTISVLQSVHQQAQYRFRVGHLTGSIVTQNGIKQGCKAAPYLWSFFSIAIMQRLVDCRSQEWLQRVCTLFADDRWTNWVITCEQDLRQAIRDIELVLQVLEDFCLEVNYRKTAVMLRLEGPQTRALLREFTYEQAGAEYLNVTVHGSHRGVPIKAQHEYLGSTVGYHRRHNLNVAKRAASAHVKYLDIKKALNGRHLLSISHRLRLWQACIYTSVMYSVPVVGVTNKGNSQLYKLTTKHLRALTGQPAHISHCPNRTIWDRSALKPPAELAVQLLENFLTDLRHSRSLQSDITNTAQLEDYVQNVIASFQSLPAHPPTHSAVLDHQGDKVPCPECGQECVSENAMRIHCKLVHKYTPAHSTRKPTVFVPHVHAKFGLPQCSLCDRKFFRWGNLKAHIRTGACVALGGDSLIRHPKEDEHLQAGRPSQSTADGLPATLPKNSEPEAFELNMPLVLRPSFLRVLPSWDSFLRTPGSKQLLTSRCVLCNMWIADAKHIKQHYHKVHHQEHPDLEAKAHNLCKPFRSQLVRGRGCLFCGVKVGAPTRHSGQCATLFQLTIAVAYCQDDRYGGPAAGRRYLQGLFSKRGRPVPTELCPAPAVATGTGGQQATKVGTGEQTVRSPRLPLPSLPGTDQLELAFSVERPLPDACTPAGAAESLITRMLLRRKDSINLAALDRGLVVFIKQDRQSILPSMLQAAKAWKESEQDSPERTQPLRTVLLACLVRELLQRLQTVSATQEGRTPLLKAGWLTEDGWVYQRWNRKEKKLVVDKDRQPMTHDNAVRTLNALKQGLTGDVIQQFKATQGLEEIEASGLGPAVGDLSVAGLPSRHYGSRGSRGPAQSGAECHDPPGSR